MGKTSAKLGKGIAVEKEKRSRSMKPSKMLENLQDGQRIFLERFPLFPARLVTFRISAVLSTSSFAESAVEVGDRCPVPVFEKTGSAA
jgi:hypothetical protein